MADTEALAEADRAWSELPKTKQQGLDPYDWTEGFKAGRESRDAEYRDLVDVATILLKTQDAFHEAGDPYRSRDEDIQWLRSQHLGTTFEEWSAELADRAAQRNESLDMLRVALASLIPEEPNQ